LSLRSPNLLKVMEYAQQEAMELNHAEVQPMHLLLGLLRLSEDVFADILRRRGIILPRVFSLLLPDLTVRSVGVPDLSLEARQLLEHAEHIAGAESNESQECGTKQLLLALLKDPFVVDILSGCGVAIEEIEKEAGSLSNYSVENQNRAQFERLVETWHKRAAMARQIGNASLEREALEHKSKYERLLNEMDS